MKQINVDTKNNYPAVHARAEGLSERMRNDVIRANMKGRIRIIGEHVMKGFDQVTDLASGQQTFLCVESSVRESPFDANKTQVFLFDDHAEFEKCRSAWDARTQP